MVSCREQPRVLAQFRDRTQSADFKAVCRISPPAAQSSEPSYTCLTSQTPTGQHDITELHLAMYDFAHCGSCRLQRELRLIRSSWVTRRRCRLSSAEYWARLLKKVLGRYQYHPIPASIGQYPIPQYRYRSNPKNNFEVSTVSILRT